MDEKIKSLTDAVNNTTESEKSKKIDTINTALKALVLDGKFSVPKKDNPTEQESKTFDGNTNNDEIASIIESLIKDEPDQAKKNQYKSDLTAALQGARDALKTLASESHQIRQAIENETTQTSDSLSGLATEVNDNMHIYSTQELAKFVEAGEQKGKSRKELRATPGYIRTIQNLILELGAQDPSIEKKKLEDGIYGNATEAGVLTIQKILNKPPYNSYKNLIEDGKPGPFTLGALLYPIDGKITWNKLLEDKKSGKLIITPELIQKKKDKDNKSSNHENKSGNQSIEGVGETVKDKNANKKVDLDKMPDGFYGSNAGIKYLKAKKEIQTIQSAMDKNAGKKVNLDKMSDGFYGSDSGIKYLKAKKEIQTIQSAMDKNTKAEVPTGSKSITPPEPNNGKLENKEKRNESVFQNIITTLRVKNKGAGFEFNDNINPYINVVYYIDGIRKNKKININNYYENDVFDYDKCSNELKKSKQKEEEKVTYRKAIEKEIKLKIANKEFTKENLFGQRTNEKINTFFNKTAKANILSIDKFDAQNYTRLSQDGKSVIVGFDTEWFDSVNDRIIIPLKEILTPNTTMINENRLKTSIRIHLEERINQKYKN